MARDVDIELLKNQFENFDLQLKRFASHLDSERRGQSETGKRVDQMVTTTKQMIELLNKHDEILRNTSGGLVLKVDRQERRIADIEKDITTAKEDNRIRVSVWLAIVSGAVSIIGLILQMTR